MDVALVGFGLCVGVLVGLTGIGGGSLMTPLLILLFGVNPMTAVGTDLAYAAVTKTVGGYKHLRQRTVDVTLAGWMALGSVPAAIAGVYALKALERASGRDFDDALLTVLGGALLVTGVATLARALFASKGRAHERHGFRGLRRDKVAAVAVGLVVGVMLGITSAGSGALIAVGLILVFRLVPTRVVGTDVFHAAILLWAAATAHVVAGNVDWGMVGTLLVGSVPGVWIGSKWSIGVAPGALRTILGAVLLASGLALFDKALGLGGGLLAAGVALGVLAAAVFALRRRRPGAVPGALPGERAESPSAAAR